MYTVNRTYKYSVVLEFLFTFLLKKHIFILNKNKRIMFRKPVTFGDVSLYRTAAGMPVSYI